MFSIFARKQEWPETPFDEIKKRARLLVIDDESFAYLELFRKNGYAIDHWLDVEDLGKLESGFYDIVLLDIQGVGKAISPTEQGLGVLRHIRTIAPAQVVIAFSSADFSLKYQDFFKLADAALAKSSDYVDFQRQVDDLLKERFSLGFYVSRVTSLTDVHATDRVKLEKEAQQAILTKEPGKLRRFLSEKMINKENAELVVGVVKFAIEVAEKWQK